MSLLHELMICLKLLDLREWNQDAIEEMLDNRDSQPFDGEWTRVYGEIEALKNKENYTEFHADQQAKTKRKAFKIMERHFLSELSDYVADDFGMIYDSVVLDYYDEWLDRLIEVYRNHQFPSGNLLGNS